MRRPILAALLAVPAPVLAQSDVSSLIAAEGLRGAEAALAARPDPSPSDRFALGGVRVLAGVEAALQLRYRTGVSGGIAEMSGLPILRLPVPPNPAPEPFEPAMIEALFAGVLTDMDAALATLGAIRDDDEVGVTVATADLWFDIDESGARGPGEGFAEVLGATLSAGFGEPFPDVTIRFDTADAAWLAAYAHLLSGVSEGVLAVAPAQAIGRVTEARDAMAALAPAPDPFGLDAQFGQYADLIATVVFALEGQPDPMRTRALREHLLAVVAENRRFWQLVAREGDDEAEWIPNKRQASATGLPFPPETGERWLAVLADAEALLNGDLLLPHWRLGPGAGVDLRALLMDPPPLDPVGLAQGAALVPFMRAGRVVDGESVALFAALMQGDAALYAVVLN